MRAVRRSHVRAGDPSLLVQGSLGSGAFNLSDCALFRTVRAADPWMDGYLGAQRGLDPSHGR